MKGYDIMKKILKNAILLFIFTFAFSVFNVNAIRNIGFTVKVPAFSVLVTCEKGIIKETTSNQYFTATTSKYVNDDSSALVEVQTYNQESGKYSKFKEAPVGQLVMIPNGDNVTLGVAYKLNARNTQSSIHRVTFGGVWNIDR